MKRLLVAIALLLVVPGIAHAFDPANRAIAIGIRAPEHVDGLVVNTLISELRARGFDAFDADAEDFTADYYAELSSGETRVDESAGIGLGTRHGEVSLGVVTSRLGGTVRVYDAVTDELVGETTFAKKNTAVMPTSV
ncbi:MAG: hypothetical protein ACLGH0_14340, partial [Thermoanaerobaculia bacterium]